MKQESSPPELLGSKRMIMIVKRPDADIDVEQDAKLVREQYLKRVDFIASEYLRLTGQEMEPEMLDAFRKQWHEQVDTIIEQDRRFQRKLKNPWFRLSLKLASFWARLRNR